MKILDRLAEPSTHAALAGIAAALLPLVPPPYQFIVQGLALLFGGAGVLKREAGSFR